MRGELPAGAVADSSVSSVCVELPIVQAQGHMYSGIMSFGRALTEMMRIWVLALFALSITLVGFAHRDANAEVRPDLSAYALPDGSVPVICFTKGDSQGEPASEKLSLCDACLLMGGANLAPACPDVLAVDFGKGVGFSQDGATLPVARLYAQPNSRAPPAVVSLDA